MLLPFTIFTLEGLEMCICTFSIYNFRISFSNIIRKELTQLSLSVFIVHLRFLEFMPMYNEVGILWLP